MISAALSAVMASGKYFRRFSTCALNSSLHSSVIVIYGILLSNYYVEVRKNYPVDQALPEVLKRSIRAIATSALILIAITLSCGFIMEGAVASILVTLCIGSSSALLLVVFVLPSLLAIFDSFIIKKKNA